MSSLSRMIVVSLCCVSAGAALAQAAEAAKAAGGKKARPWVVSLMAYTFRQRTMFEAIDQTKALGLKHMEAFSWQKISDDTKDLPFNQDAPVPVLARVKNKLDDAGVRLSGFYFHDLGKDEAATRKVFDFCKLMDIPTIICEPAPDKFDAVEKLADEYRINIAVHNHPGPSPYSDPDAVLKVLKDRGPRIGACADTGHWVRSGLNPVECLRKYKGRIIQLHLKDVKEPKKEAPDVPWGTGVGDVKAQLEELNRQGFSGVFSIEYEANPDNPGPDVRKCIDFFREVAKSLGR
jgi:sugar phosphate isomerase/epimerase